MSIPDDQNLPPCDSLEYRDGREDVPALGRQIFAAVGLGSVSFGIIAGVAFVWIICNLRLSPGPEEIHWIFPAICSAVGVFVIGAFVTKARRNGQKVVVAGIFIGIGVCMLVEGICFTSGF